MRITHLGVPYPTLDRALDAEDDGWLHDAADALDALPIAEERSGDA